MTQEVFVAVLTPVANWLIPDRGILAGGEVELRERLGRLDRVLLLAVTRERKRKL